MEFFWDRDEALEAAGLSGVGDVAGERGGRAELLRRLGARGVPSTGRTHGPGDRVRQSRRGRGAGNPTWSCCVQPSGSKSSSTGGRPGRRSRSSSRPWGISGGRPAVPGTWARERRRGGGPRVGLVDPPRRQGSRYAWFHEPETPSKPPGCRSRRCRRRTLRSCVRHALAVYNTGDVDTFVDLFTDDGEMETDPGFPRAGRSAGASRSGALSPDCTKVGRAVARSP